MDQRVVLAVAGSGKTSYIVDSIDEAKRALIITYTENNYRNLRDRIVGRFGFIPENTRIYTYFSFLYSFCLRPLCGDLYGFRGINWEMPPMSTRRFKQNDLRHYRDQNGRIYASRIASFMINFLLVDDIRQRISKYFDYLYVDEVQDFAGYDFDLLLDVLSNNINTCLVGDFFQHTYDTSRDGAKNRNLHNDFTYYCTELEKRGLAVDNTTLSNSYRCSPTTCNFVTEKLGININSHQDDETVLEFVDDEGWAEAIFDMSHVVKLFYQSHQTYPCYSNNWGASKGVDDYDAVCVVLNKKSEILFRKGQLSSLPSTTRNKLYVACTRARSQLYFVPERFLSKFKLPN